MAGTKPYMAPEVLACGCTSPPTAGSRGRDAYGPEVDWWSLGVTAFELSSGKRPFAIRSATRISDCLAQTCAGAKANKLWSAEWSSLMVNGLLRPTAAARLSTLSALRAHAATAELDWAQLSSLDAPFVPSPDRLHCDPAYELEEMIVERRPLHKKKKRLRRQQTLLTQRLLDDKQVMR